MVRFSQWGFASEEIERYAMQKVKEHVKSTPGWRSTSDACQIDDRRRARQDRM
jgi:hypothetical protein